MVFYGHHDARWDPEKTLVPGHAQLILDALDDPSCAWSVGTFGAIGEFPSPSKTFLGFSPGRRFRMAVSVSIMGVRTPKTAFCGYGAWGYALFPKASAPTSTPGR
jgi:hypothetical protein